MSECITCSVWMSVCSVRLDGLVSLELDWSRLLFTEVRCSRCVQRVFNADGSGSVDVTGGSGGGHGVGPGGGGWLGGLAHQGHTLALTGDGQT